VRREALQSLHDWRVIGRIGVTSEQEGWHAGLYWNQRGSAYAINLIGPLGQGRVRIWGDGRSVSVQTADGRVLSAADPEQLLAATMDMRLPVSGLIYWIRGLPDPNQQSELTGDKAGRLIRLEQNGWMIDYLRYEQIAGLELPTRIRARQNDLTVQLVVSRWDLQPDDTLPTLIQASH
jgi:outer membrane lipoprotein LolB